MASLMAKAMYNWMVEYPLIKGKGTRVALTREDYVNSWGALGGAVYDWGAQLYQSGMGNTVRNEDAFTGMADQLLAKNPVGGAIGSMYAAPSGGAGSGTGYIFGELGNDMYRYYMQVQLGITGGERAIMARKQMVDSWGELGGRLWDWAQQQQGMFGAAPDQATFAARADYMALTTAPAGSWGSSYQAAPPSQYDQAIIDNLIKQGKLTEAQIAQLVRQGKLTEAQAAQIIQNMKMQEAELAANPRDWIKAWYYQRGETPPGAPPGPTGAAGSGINPRTGRPWTLEEQNPTLPGGPPGATTGKPMPILPGDYGGAAPPAPWLSETLPPGALSPKPTTQPYIAPNAASATPGGYYYDENGKVEYNAVLTVPSPPGAGPTAGTGGAGPTAGPTTADFSFLNPRDVARAEGLFDRPQARQNYLLRNAPPWIRDLLLGKPVPENRLGTFPLAMVNPNQITAAEFNRLRPSELSGMQALASSSGWMFPDYITAMMKSQTRQPGMAASPVSWGGF